MAFEPKLIALDLDGTLLSSAKLISGRTERVLRAWHERGAAIVLCTGRPARSTRVYAESLNATSHAVTLNGAMVYDFERDRTTWHKAMSKEAALKVIEELESSFPDAWSLFETLEGWYCHRDFETYFEHETTAPLGVGNVRELVCGEVSSFLLHHPEVEARLLAETLAHLDVHCTYSSRRFLEVSAKGVHKRAALEIVAADLGVGSNEVIAFGNAHNDQEMLAWAGLGVAVANADDETLAMADRVTASNDEDGVAAVLESLFEN